MPARKSTRKPNRTESRKIDEQVEETFPASDPPAFMGGKHIIGAPKKRETPAADRVKPRRQSRKRV